jgi:RNA polymerase sigma-70 factor (ECF subfamily)
MAGVPSTHERFRALFDAHNAAIRAFCVRRLPVDDANEAASDVFLVAWRRVEDVPAGDEALLWLYGVARNVVRNHQRSSRRRVRLAVRTNAVAAVPDDGPEVQVIRGDEHDQVAAAMSRLPDADRELLQLKIWEELTNDQVAAVLGLTKRAVENRYTRALGKISRHLERGVRTTTSSPFSAEQGGVVR